MSNWIHLRPCISSPYALLLTAAQMATAKPISSLGHADNTPVTRVWVPAALFTIIPPQAQGLICGIAHDLSLPDSSLPQANSDLRCQKTSQGYSQ